MESLNFHLRALKMDSRLKNVKFTLEIGITINNGQANKFSKKLT
ncbi:hypothetical protein SAMN05421796_10210 [Chryseobacterium piscicola]|uniref:Uncharacterized protein n=1 Tax=Chryseobacterium piscicola TaxID=551459 RepID=A0A1N7L484_9FLAO|nr:hypothetical protein SAMN05421796_10210 [Chryseobacterium piscicola]